MHAARRWVVVTGLVAAAFGCSAQDEDLPPVQAICDGSDDVRFVFSMIDGFPAHYGFRFTGAYGNRYLVIDGRCEYWLGSETLSGLRVGHLDADAAAALAEEIHFGRYFTAADYRDPGGCTDAGLAVVDDGTATLRTTCFPREEAPRVFWQAFERAYWVSELDASATPAWQRSTLLALNDPRELVQRQPVEAQRTPQRWTAPLDLGPRSVATLDLTRGLGADAGVLVEDAPTLALLAELRGAARGAYSLLVVDDSDRNYELLVRDEPPPAVRAALKAALALPE